MYPMKGYTVTVPLSECDAARVSSSTVVDGHFFTSRYGRQLRCTAVGEFDGWSVRARAAPDADTRRRIVALYPHLADAVERADVVCGLRPMSADGSLLCGRVGHGNLFINSAHGQHGWKLSLGSAELCARALAAEERPSQLDNALFGAVRYEPLFCRLASLLSRE